MGVTVYSFSKEINHLCAQGIFNTSIAAIMRKFFSSYLRAISQNGYHLRDVEPVLRKLLASVVEQVQNPYKFELFHSKITQPFDYYRFGIDFIRPLIDLEHSKVYGLSHLDQAEKQIAKNENVIFLSNHQVEPDPQVISTMLESSHPQLAEEMIFVAGHRVITDPVAIPFSLGCNLICIFSKKHVEYPPEQKEEKLMHNRRAMKKLEQLLAEGGRSIYIAPSGGRDRPDAKGVLQPAAFDPQSLEMLVFLAKQANTPTHFYTLTLETSALLPPPKRVKKEIGEKREAQCAPVFLHFGAEVNLESLVKDTLDKKQKRKRRAEILTHIIQENYKVLGKDL